MLSNYPPGVTTNDLPGWRPYTPPDEMNDCVSCGEDDLVSYDRHIYKGQLVCSRCVPHCEECGESMSDENRLKFGELARYAGAEGHAECIAYRLVSELSGVDFSMVDFLDREELDAWLVPMEVLS